MTVAKIWNGSTWVVPNGFRRPRVWNGSAWVAVNPYVFNVGNASKTLTVGYQYNPASKYSAATEEYGFSTGLYGSISTTNWPYSWVGNTRIDALQWYTTGFGDPLLNIWVYGDDVIPNAGWTSITVNSTTYTRASASYYTFPGSSPQPATRWLWTSISNPFPAAGNTINVTWNL